MILTVFVAVAFLADRWGIAWGLCAVAVWLLAEYLIGFCRDAQKERVMMMPKTVADLWQAFDRRVIPDVGPLQRYEMKKAFYAGVVSALLMAANTMDEDMTEDRGAEILG